MGILVIFSLIVKAFGAGLEIAAQSLISQWWSVEIFGTYSFFVALAEIFFNTFFAGIIKFNNYYIPQGIPIVGLKKRYYVWFAFPIILVGLAVSLLAQYWIMALACVAGFTYLLAMDSSSSLMSYGKYKTALIGEYTFGRIFLLIVIMLFSVFRVTNIKFLYWAYIVQFAAVFVFYIPALRETKGLGHIKSKPPKLDIIKKYAIFQSTEISHTIVMQTSVIIQYIFGGAYQAALVSIVLIVRRLINFISGPTSKLYQPEFSKKYSAGDKKGLISVYAQITRLQLCFMMPVFAFLIAAPEVFLKIFNNELITYAPLVQGTSLVFLYMIAFGPQSNFLSMTGNEKSDTLSNWFSVAVMYILMFIFKWHTYFVVIGFCSQIVFCTTYKLAAFWKYMNKLPMPAIDYIRLVSIAIVSIIFMSLFKGNVFFSMGVCCVHFFLDFMLVIPKIERDELIEKLFIKTKRRKRE